MLLQLRHDHLRLDVMDGTSKHFLVSIAPRSPANLIRFGPTGGVTRKAPKAAETTWWVTPNDAEALG